MTLLCHLARELFELSVSGLTGFFVAGRDFPERDDIEFVDRVLGHREKPDGGRHVPSGQGPVVLVNGDDFVTFERGEDFDEVHARFYVPEQEIYGSSW